MKARVFSKPAFFGGILGGALSFFGIAVLFVATGCIPAQAIHQARTQAAVGRGHANDAGLPEEARLLGEDADDAWSAQLYLLDGTRMSEAVEARLKARGDLPEGYEK